MSIKVKMILLLFGMVLIFMVMTLLANTIFMKAYYTSQQEKKLETCFEQVKVLDYSSPDVAQQLWRLEENHNIQILIIYNSKSSNINEIFYCSSHLRDSLFLPEGEEGGKWFVDWLIPPEEGEDSVDIFSTVPGFGTRINPAFASSYLSLYAKAQLPYQGEQQNFFIIINSPLAAIEQGIAISNRFTAIVAAIMMLICVISSLVLGGRVTAPILRVSTTANKIAHMDFSETVEYDSNDELGELADSINGLSKQLRSKILDLSVANEKLHQELLMRERVDNMRKELISNVSHELKTPLAIILGYCEGLQLNINSDEREYYCSVIEDEAIKMSNLANRLLDLAELESGERTPSFCEFDLTELAKDRLNKLEPLLEERSVSTEFDAEESFVCEGDPERMEEVLNNLLTNAKNHTPDGGRIAVSLKRESEYVNCTVYNSGSHIPEESLDRIWDSFYKVDKARTRAYGGSGLGLKIVSSILDLHKSSYGARNTEDGVEFYFTMHIASPAESAIEEVAVEPEYWISDEPSDSDGEFIIIDGEYITE